MSLDVSRVCSISFPVDELTLQLFTFDSYGLPGLVISGNQVMLEII
jgi:hypothetical protein